MNARAWLRPLLLIALTVAAAGCAGGDRVGLAGRITLDGQPVEYGAILFIPTEGTLSPTAGSEVVDGEYEVSRDKGPKIGVFRVEIRSQRKSGRKVQAPPPARPGELMEEWVEAIPAAYNRESKLRVELQPKNNELNFDLHSK
jgi:hypothetical protein